MQDWNAFQSEVTIISLLIAAMILLIGAVMVKGNSLESTEYEDSMKLLKKILGLFFLGFVILTVIFFVFIAKKPVEVKNLVEINSYMASCDTIF